nr:MAG TPA_asm: hypothetical protein [Caudoviricetes sp.]
MITRFKSLNKLWLCIQLMNPYLTLHYQFIQKALHVMIMVTLSIIQMSLGIRESRLS